MTSRFYGIFIKLKICGASGEHDRQSQPAILDAGCHSPAGGGDKNGDISLGEPLQDGFMGMAIAVFHSAGDDGGGRMQLVEEFFAGGGRRTVVACFQKMTGGDATSFKLLRQKFFPFLPAVAGKENADVLVFQQKNLGGIV